MLLYLTCQDTLKYIVSMKHFKNYNLLEKSEHKTCFSLYNKELTFFYSYFSSFWLVIKFNKEFKQQITVIHV